MVFVLKAHAQLTQRTLNLKMGAHCLHYFKQHMSQQFYEWQLPN